MSLDRRHVNTLLVALPLAATPAFAQRRRETLVLAMVLEPPSLDPTTGASAAIGEIVHYNIFEGLTKITMDGSVVPLLAESWTVTPDGKATTFQLKRIGRKLKILVVAAS